MLARQAASRGKHPHRLSQTRLRDVTADLGIPYLDMLPILIESHRSGEDSYLDHCHHTANGNKIIPDSIYQFLADQQLSEK